MRSLLSTITKYKSHYFTTSNVHLKDIT